VRILGGAFIGAGVSIGDDSEIGPNVSILHGCKIGRNCLLHPGVCIGADGYGFRWLGDHHHKIPQLGIVVIGDDVEIGANACIDRATMGETRIGDGTKIDNLVHIAHNNQVGRNVIMTALVGIAGSCKIGDGAVFAGQAGVIDHVEIGEAAMVGAKALVTKNCAANTTVWGIPARSLDKTRKQLAAVARLPGLVRRLFKQGEELEELKRRVAELEHK
jgi:UDP-3-O-[3-hydroxymyristoyl] glucosamine N-acyltransferase